MTYRLIICFFTIVLLTSCANENFRKVPDKSFLGTWELHGRSMFEGIKVKIEKTSNDKLIGHIVELNDNKYIKMFVDSNDLWISGIKRTSNYQFKLTEKKIAMDLFALYGLGTSNEFKAEFIDENTIGLAGGNSDPTKSDIIYKRIE